MCKTGPAPSGPGDRSEACVRQVQFFECREDRRNGCDTVIRQVQFYERLEMGEMGVIHV